MKEKLKGTDRLAAWEKGGSVESFVKTFMGKFDECQFYMGESYADDEPKEGMLIVAFWVDETNDKGETFFYFKDCYRQIKS